MRCWPEDQVPGRITFISDLHLFSARTTAAKHEAEMIELAKQSDMIVFGGDLFDFRWSRIGNALHTANSAISWLQHFMARCGRQEPQARQFVFLFGNHDGDRELRCALDEFACSESGFSIAGDLLRVGDVAFLHGDAIEGDGSLAGFEDYRARWADKRQANRAQSTAYDAAVALRVHRVAAAMAHRRNRTFQRLLNYLNEHHCGPREGVKRVVFGHTHRFLPGRPFGGVLFYNPGATVRGVPFHPIVLEKQSN